MFNILGNILDSIDRRQPFLSIGRVGLKTTVLRLPFEQLAGRLLSPASVARLVLSSWAEDYAVLVMPLPPLFLSRTATRQPCFKQSLVVGTRIYVYTHTLSFPWALFFVFLLTFTFLLCT